MKESCEYETKYIKALDGIRAVAIIIIVWYHFWQQSWLIPRFGLFDIDFIPRYGFIFVDMMILISSFCLFLPYARSKIYNEEIPDTKKFYVNRIARIVPSYLLSMIVSIIFIVVLSETIESKLFIKDTLTHLFFTHNLFNDTLLYTKYIGALWTVGVEMQFYLIFPYLAKRFIKNPVVTYIVMMIIGLISLITIRHFSTENNINLLVNHTLTFIVVYANGMLGAWFYIMYTKNNKRNSVNDLVFTVISIFAVMLYTYFAKSIGIQDVKLWQLDNRFVLSLIFITFIVSTLLSCKIYRKIFENKFMKYIALISFNLYIYHAFIAVKLKELKIPYWSGVDPPNMTGNTKWQWEYTILCIIISIFVASIVTFYVERPIAKFIKGKFTKNNELKNKQ